MLRIHILNSFFFGHKCALGVAQLVPKLQAHAARQTIPRRRLRSYRKILNAVAKYYFLISKCSRTGTITQHLRNVNIMLRLQNQSDDFLQSDF